MALAPVRGRVPEDMPLQLKISGVAALTKPGKGAALDVGEGAARGVRAAADQEIAETHELDVEVSVPPGQTVRSTTLCRIEFR